MHNSKAAKKSDCCTKNILNPFYVMRIALFFLTHFIAKGKAIQHKNLFRIFIKLFIECNKNMNMDAASKIIVSF